MNQDHIAGKLTHLLKHLILPAILLLIFSVGCADQEGQLKPLNEGTENSLIINNQPQLVTFSELQADPAFYRDQLIRVTGTYIPLSPPDCYPFSGPGADWALISEGLRLDVVGFERAKKLVSQDTIMTVDGFFRLYKGPIGCGKNAPVETAWFLEILQVVQPNPLVSSGRLASAGGFVGIPSPQASPTDLAGLGESLPLIEGTEQPTNVPTATPGGLSPAVPTSTSTPTPAGTPRTTAIPTASPTPTVTPIGRGTTAPTATNTPRSAQGVPTNTPRSGPLPTSPALPTATIGGYPSASTVTPEPY
ncbi:MAG: hypothetical protein PVH03_08395 [Chloroflexota bacterium]|jgi:hypothetical protein